MPDCDVLFSLISFLCVVSFISLPSTVYFHQFSFFSSFLRVKFHQFSLISLVPSDNFHPFSFTWFSFISSFVSVQFHPSSLVSSAISLFCLYQWTGQHSENKGNNPWRKITKRNSEGSNATKDNEWAKFSGMNRLLARVLLPPPGRPSSCFISHFTVRGKAL